MRLATLLLAAFSSLAPAASIDFNFKAIVAQVSFNGGPLMQCDLSVDLLANAASRVGDGVAGSDRYLNLKGFFSSRTLGLSNVEAVTPLAVHVGMPSAEEPFRNATALLVSGDIVNGIFNLGALSTWDRVSTIGPLRGSATASGPLNVLLKNGASLSITTLESAEPFGNTEFQATFLPMVNISETKIISSEGTLRKLGETNLAMHLGGNVRHFRLVASTRFHDPTGAPIRDSLLRPGDELSIRVSADDPETAVEVVLLHARDRK